MLTLHGREQVINKGGFVIGSPAIEYQIRNQVQILVLILDHHIDGVNGVEGGEKVFCHLNNSDLLVLCIGSS